MKEVAINLQPTLVRIELALTLPVPGYGISDEGSAHPTQTRREEPDAA